jgi:HD-GYP domain-containing protein (c-di-GMP phosphodiesterase class II)
MRQSCTLPPEGVPPLAIGRYDMNAGDLYLRRLHRLKWAVQGLTALFLVAIEAYYYFIWRVPFVEDLVDWLIGMAIAGVLIEITFRAVANVQSRLQQEITERQRAEETLRKAHDGLELRVKERTTELAKANESLRAEITEHRRVEEEIERRTRELAALNAIATAMMQSALDLDEVLQRAADGVVEGLGCNTAFIFLLDEEEKIFKGGAVSTKGKILEKMNAIIGVPLLQVKIPARRDFNEAMSHLLDGRPTIKHDFYELARPLWSKPVCYALQGLLDSRTFFAMPLLAKGKTVGGVVASTHEDLSEANTETIMTFAHQAAIAIENARLYEVAQQELAERVRAEEKLRQSYAKLQKALEGTVNALISAIELKDPYTAGHQQRVTRLACAIAHEMDLSEEQFEGLRMAALIHDIGKIAVPAEILAKPGILSDFEYGLIRSHAQAGHDILNGATELPWPVADIVLQHHERMDGSGYPQGLSGEKIMLEARILAVADVVAAMASHRPYRPALGLDKALEEISHNRGVLYDSEVVDACLELFAEKGFTFE